MSYIIKIKTALHNLSNVFGKYYESAEFTLCCGLELAGIWKWLLI